MLLCQCEFLSRIWDWGRGRERERERERETEGDTESEAGSRLRAVSTEPDTGLKLVNCEIMI